MELYQKLTTVFILLFVASISAGMALKDAVPNATMGGIGFATLFLLCSAFCAGKARQKKG
ncbi:hypothetical protein [Bacillus sp. XF8]|uniref:hypothetical protein n=1 Tax=Bacillus sp. XF8 TaxID=2819289 RepID=UPI001AA0386F|nr:hypothetical protein [Bacillus sp. XF8]MBO1581344.1 hypothetical protein [Bacillus sp. XF8]